MADPTTSTANGVLPSRLLKESSARVGLTLSLCELCGSPCLCGENANKNTPQRHRDRTENHREDLLMLLVAFFSSLLEPCRPLPNKAKSALERQPNLPDQAVVEQPAENRDSVRHASRRSELWKRYGRVRGPVTSRF